MKIIVIGGGVASYEAALAARKQNPDAEIILICGEKVLPYRRPNLSALLADFTVNEKTFFIKPATFYEENRIQIKLNTHVAAINGKQLLLSDGSTESYDKLVIATGGTACRPPLPGADGSNVYTLRNYADLEKLDAAARSASSAVIIGCGVLGLEIAESLLKRGLKINLLERDSRIFSSRIDEARSLEMQEKLRAFPGLELHFNANVQSILPSGAMLADGTLVTGDIVIFAAGVRPAVEVFSAAGIKIERGIVVNEKMETSVPDIYAAGDAVQFDGKCFGLYADARTTGTIAGTNAAGGAAVYAPDTPSPVRCFAFNLKLVMP